MRIGNDFWKRLDAYVSKGTLDSMQDISEKQMILSVCAEMLKKKEPLDFDLTFIQSDKWRDLMKMWLDYKAEKKQAYKTQGQIKLLLKRLLNMSNHSYNTALEYVEGSIACNYSGIHPVKSMSNGKQSITDEDYKSLIGN